MSKFKILVSLIGIMIAGLAFASSNDEISDRIKKVGEVCIEGVDCASASAVTMVATAAGASVDGASVESNYNKSCAICHNAGAAGAPKFGDAAAWVSRLEKGMNVLYSSIINGLPPAMPQKGMCFSCSDDDLRALVDYMVSAAK
ncbi:MAG: c-type cytochrome [Candidatus Azotimanducaceae bacterium WSBS_2022_MAG_OTU7]